MGTASAVKMETRWRWNEGRIASIGDRRQMSSIDVTDLGLPDAAWIHLARRNELSPEEQEGDPSLCPEVSTGVRSRSAAVDIYKGNKPVERLDRPEIVTAGEPIPRFALRTSRLWSRR